MGNLLGGCKICLALSQLSFRLLSFRNVTKVFFRVLALGDVLELVTREEGLALAVADHRNGEQTRNGVPVLMEASFLRLKGTNLSLQQLGDTVEFGTQFFGMRNALESLGQQFLL